VIAGNAHASALPAMFQRGHLDHLALTASSAEAFAIIRRRLVERGACDGAIQDLGPVHNIWFQDPDGISRIPSSPLVAGLRRGSQLFDRRCVRVGR
jgi:hypothetical protein